MGNMTLEQLLLNVLMLQFLHLVLFSQHNEVKTMKISSLYLCVK